MRDIIFTFFNYFVFFYTSMLAIFFVTFAFLSFISLKRRKDYYVESYMRKTIKESPYTPGISVIAPAFNEEKTIIDNVNSMLALEYPLFEVVIVNDGSTDSTLEEDDRILRTGRSALCLYRANQNQTVPKTPQILQPEIQPTHRCRQREWRNQSGCIQCGYQRCFIILILSARM